MSNYDPLYNRSKYGNFNINKGFVSLIGGTDAYFLEDEHNESQWIQNEARAEILRSKYFSGILKKEPNDIIFSTKINLLLFKNVFSIINGYNLDVSGNLGFINNGTVEQDPLLNNILLQIPPLSGSRYDFAYLEVYFKEVRFTDDIWVNGNKNNFYGTINNPNNVQLPSNYNDLFDPRINGETCRRVQMQWTIRTSSNVDFNVYPDGFDNTLTNGNIKAYGGNTIISNYSFWRSDLNLSTKFFNRDLGLWVAGNGIQGEMGTINGYVYAIPLFKIFRRNSSGYSESNPNGGINYTIGATSDRPDGKFSNLIYQDDITDMRNLIETGDLKKLLENNFKDLLMGKLNTNTQINIAKDYFGLPGISNTVNTQININCNNNIKNNNIEPTHVNSPNFIYIPSVEQEGIMINNNGYFEYDINTSIAEGAISLILSAQVNNNKNIWSITNNTTLLALDIEDNKISVKDSIGEIDNINLSEIGFKINKFYHLATTWSKTSNILRIFLNGKLIKSMSIMGRLSGTTAFKFVLGHSDTNYNCSNVILDLIEYVNIYKTNFNLPADIVSGNANLIIDMQKGRRKYSNAVNNSTITERLTSISDINGNVHMVVDAPIGALFVDNILPRLRFSDESTLVNAIFDGFNTNQLIIDISGLGNTITYNFVLVADLEFLPYEGLFSNPSKIYKLQGELLEEAYLPVASNKQTAEYDLNLIYPNATFNTNIPDNVIVYNNFNIGFNCGIKYHVQGNNSNTIVIPRVIYDQTVNNVYTVNVIDDIDNINILDNLLVTNSNITITLTQSINDTKILEIILGTNIPSCTFNSLSGGIDNLTYNENISFMGDGLSDVFEKSFDSRVLSSQASILNEQTIFTAFVDNVMTPITVNFYDTFISFNFTTIPNNMSRIKITVNLEYDPMRSERFTAYYETLQYQGFGTVEKINELNNSQILQHLENIFTITEGNNEVPGVLNSINIANLPTIDFVDNDLIPTAIMGPATNIRSPIDYAINNTNGVDNLPLINNLNLNVSQTLANRGFKGIVNIDDKGIFAARHIGTNCPHLNILPMLVRDIDAKVYMAIFTTYDTNNQVYINGEDNETAVDIFKLKENYLIK